MISLAMIKKLLICLPLSLVSLTALAEQLPQPASRDTRVQVFSYDPDDVYVIHAKAGYATLVQLEDGEVINDEGGLGMGQADAWNIAVKGNNIFFKPVSAMPDTNLVLVTNKRTYAFILTTNTSTDDTLTYIAKFNYPETPVVVAKQSMPTYVVESHKTADGTQIYIDAAFNKNYYYRGDSQLKPTGAWDDGRFTYFQYNHASDLPAIYRVLPDGTETLVNTHVVDDVLVVHEIDLGYRVRLGDSVGEIKNSYDRLPKFNTTGTDSSNWRRVDLNITGGK